MSPLFGDLGKWAMLMLAQDSIATHHRPSHTSMNYHEESNLSTITDSTSLSQLN